MLVAKGYNLVIGSWENDGDSYSTQILNCDSKEEAILLAKFACIFTSSEDKIPYSPGCNLENICGYGNDAVDGDELVAIIIDFFNTYGTDEIREKYRIDKFDKAAALRLTRDLLGFPSCEAYLFDYGDFCRVAEEIDIYFVKEAPEKIKF